jgi:hypothetical protein
MSAKANAKDKDKYENNQSKSSKSLLNTLYRCKVSGKFSEYYSPVLESLQGP